MSLRVLVPRAKSQNRLGLGLYSMHANKAYSGEANKRCRPSRFAAPQTDLIPT